MHLESSNQKTDLDLQLIKLIAIQKGYIRVKVIPQSQKNAVRAILADNTVKIAIQKPPEKNKANEELVAFLSKLLKTKQSGIKIISGFTDTTKLIRINQDNIES